MKNNNRKVIRLLAEKLYRFNRRRNHILAAAAAVSLFLLFSVFSIIAGRIHAEKLMYTRMAGTTATTYLEDATLEQAVQIEDLAYIQDVGMEYIFDGICKEDMEIGVRVYVEDETFDSMFRPAYTQIYGNYPEDEQETMLSFRILGYIGVEHPEIGMKVTLENPDGTEEEFTLSGFYKEYMGDEIPSCGFFSKAYYEKQGNSTGQAALLAIRQKIWYDGEDVEERLYEDIPTIDKAQQFIGGDSVSYAAVAELAGGFDIGICIAVLIVLCASMLIYNVMALSLHREIRQYGLLKTLGVTSGQIRRIVWHQVIKVLAWGLIWGTVSGGIFVFGILPRILEGKYLNGFGEASAAVGFSPVLYLITVILTAGSTLFSSFMSVRKVGKMTPVAALSYSGGMLAAGKKRRVSSKSNQISVMAWRNIFRNRKSALVTLTSLLLGFMIALSSVVIIRGIDYQNELEQEDDFELLALSAPFLSEGYQESDIYFDESFCEKIEQMDGIEKIRYSAGGYLALDSADAVWQPLLTGSRLAEGMQEDEELRRYAESVRNYYMAGFTVVDQDYIDALEKCCEEYGLTLDTEGLREGSSAVAFHFNELSRELEKDALSCIGNSFSLKTFTGEELGAMKFGGYLKRSQKGLPPCQTETSTSGYPTLLISRKGFERLGIEKKIFAIDINVKEEAEPQIKYELNRMIEDLEKDSRKTEDTEDGIFGTEYSVHAKSDAIAAAQANLLPIRVLMYTVSGLLICMGVFNYFHITASSLEARQKEFAVMKSLGMTGKQLRQMLIREGVYYSSIIAIFLATAGSGILRLVYHFGKTRVSYMQFYYPVGGLVVTLALVYAGCICLPLWILHRNTSKC